MNHTLQKICAISGAITLLAVGSAQAATLTLTTVADGRTQTFGGDSVDTTATGVGITQSGGLTGNGIFEFDLTSIDDGATINSVTFEYTHTRFVSNTGSNPAKVDVFAYLGDGIVDIADHTASGDKVVDSTTPQGGTGGDVDSFLFSDVSMVSSALAGDMLTLRFETNSFASMSIASLENTTWDAARIIVDYEVAAVPVPASLPLALVAFGGLYGVSRRRRRS